MRDDRDVRERLPIGSVPSDVVGMPVRVHEVADGLVGPLTNLRDVLPCARGKVSGVDDQHVPIADDDDGVALRVRVRAVLVTDRVDPLPDLDGASLAGQDGVIRSGGTGRRGNEQQAEKGENPLKLERQRTHGVCSAG
jgi:hypothetical protein